MTQLLALYKRVGKRPEIIVCPVSVEAIQEFVGGHYEAIHLGEGIYLLCNEEARLMGLEPNFAIGQTLILGNVLFVSSDGEDFSSLTAEQAYVIIQKLFGTGQFVPHRFTESSEHRSAR